jgi:hypothetical protein
MQHPERQGTRHNSGRPLGCQRGCPQRSGRNSSRSDLASERMDARSRATIPPRSGTIRRCSDDASAPRRRALPARHDEHAHESVPTRKSRDREVAAQLGRRREPIGRVGAAAGAAAARSGSRRGRSSVNVPG